MIANVVSVAFGLRRMVASIYKPFSVKAFGSFTFPPADNEVEIFDFIISWRKSKCVGKGGGNCCRVNVAIDQ